MKKLNIGNFIVIFLTSLKVKMQERGGVHIA